jgi:hypothetical protein
MTPEGDGAEGASNASSFTGTKAGAPPSGGATTTGVRRLAPPIAPPLARAPQPLENEIGVQPVPTRDRRDRRGTATCAVTVTLLSTASCWCRWSRHDPRRSLAARQYPARLPCLRWVCRADESKVRHLQGCPLPTHTPVGTSRPSSEALHCEVPGQLCVFSFLFFSYGFT